ncbi:ABC transporter ATP-binding protein [Dactylosporangium aurantiacum]|uniref:ABC transporter ATP-binding protein n=1 Tax=Dactylosporangium aurantiacum TaxID=35754 RepID=UPI0005266BF8|nr:ABC transporter ATP-binding protein [Dactylosporangium aurantiacum]MDG6102899.1 ABC transporter ATP-binding protein [Dactylosporangium aurantiacum]
MAAKEKPVSLRSLLPYLREHRGTLGVVAVLSLLGSLTTLAQPLLTRDVLDGLQAARPVGRTVALLVTVLAAVALLNALRDYLLQRTAEGLVLTARRRLTRHLLRLPIAEYDQRRTGDLLSRVGADTTLLRAVVTSGLFETVTGAVMVLGAAGAMLLLDPVLFLTAGGGLALGLSIAVVFSRRVRPASQEAQARIGDMTSAVERALTAARTIRASNAEQREAATVEAGAEEAYRAGVRIAKLQALVGPASVAAIQGAFLLLLGVGGARVANGTISVGDLVAFVLYLFFLVMPLGQALHAYTQLQTGLGALQRMHDILDVPAEQDAGTAAVTSGPVAVAFDGVTFAYAGAAQPVVRDVSFAVAYGTRTALVGPSGAGKSTLLQLVERFYDVTDGTVRVAGVDVRDLPRQVLRAQLGYVEQEAPVLAGTLRDNLRLAAPAATDAQMLEVLDAVNLADVVDRAPEGLGAQVGEGGVLLSGGERQRLAIARTLLAAPPILLLDEPTSNLDARNEVALRQAIDTVAHNRTMIVVAHRLSTVVDADQIVVMEGGRVVATGRHADLLETSDLYRELATNQLLVA